MDDSNQNEISNRDETNRNLITRDFLGTCAVIQSNKLNPVVHRQLNDLNQQPTLPDNSALDLKLLLSSSAPHRRPLMNYQSVCTLDKVRSALERAGHESQSKRSTSPSTPSTSTSMIRRRSDYNGEVGEGKSTEGGYSSTGMIAGRCPRCLMYVLISRGNHRCPQCDSHVPGMLSVPVVVAKKPRLDLN